jgi:MFS family permease
MRPSINAYLSKKTKDGQGATMGLAFSFESLGRVAGPLVLGGLMAKTNLIAPFYMVTLVLAIGIVLFIKVEMKRVTE